MCGFENSLRLLLAGHPVSIGFGDLDSLSAIVGDNTDVVMPVLVSQAQALFLLED